MTLSTTTKNWLTTTGGTFAIGAATYFTMHGPGAADGWAVWRPVLVSSALAGVLAAYHAYQDKSGKPSPSTLASAATKTLSVLALLVPAATLLSGCLTSAPMVPVTPANSAQVSSCQNTAALHNAFTIAGFGFSGSTAALAGVAASEPDSNGSLKTALGVAGAIVGGVAIVAVAVGELTNSNFQNSNCASVVGPLPTAPNPSPSSPATAGH